tara:strand:+ start:7948 stop:9627 length:1680 start_codon:yes stop_codon:yes gene_type:complete
MKNKLLFKYIILILISQIFSNEGNINSTELLKTADKLEKINQIDDALKIYIQLFNINKANPSYFKKIKKILLEKKKYEELIVIYKQHIDNFNTSKDVFLIEVELLEIKIWNNSNDWEIYLNDLINKYIINTERYNYGIKKNKLKYIIQQLTKNKKNDEAYELVKKIRKFFKEQLNENNLNKNNLSEQDTSFLSREMISIFSNNKQYKKAIEESILFLKSNPKNNFYKTTLKEQIITFGNKIIKNRKKINFNFPITNKQFNANTFFNYQALEIYNQEDINYMINIYNEMIKNDIAKNEAKLELANINYNILNDLDNAYKLYSELENKNTQIGFEATINKIDILIKKGYIDSASVSIRKKIDEIQKNSFIHEKEKILNDLNYKNIQILFYKGDYMKMKEALDTFIENTKLQNKNLNDLLEIKNISLFFNEDEKNFKKYSSIQYKIKMNKDFEAMSGLIQLINSENILISELAQFQYALIQIKKGNIKEAQSIIESISNKTIFSEISLIINAEIEDHMKNNYEKSIKLYENFLNKYPNSIYKENIRKRLNLINDLMKVKVDS